MVHDRHPVAEPVGLLHVVRRQQHRQPVAVQLVEDLPQGEAALRVEAGGRLVEEQDVRIVRDAARDHQTLGHAARERVDAGRGAVGQTELLQQFRRPRPRLPPVHPEVPAVVVEVLPYGEAAVERVGLGDDADRLLGQGRFAGHVHATDAGPARRRHHAGREHADCGRLAGAVGAEQAEDLARGDGQVESVDRLHAAGIRLREPLRLDDILEVAGDGHSIRRDSHHPSPWFPCLGRANRSWGRGCRL